MFGSLNFFDFAFNFLCGSYLLFYFLVVYFTNIFSLLLIFPQYYFSNTSRCHVCLLVVLFMICNIMFLSGFCSSISGLHSSSHIHMLCFESLAPLRSNFGPLVVLLILWPRWLPMIIFSSSLSKLFWYFTEIYVGDHIAVIYSHYPVVTLTRTFSNQAPL